MEPTAAILLTVLAILAGMGLLSLIAGSPFYTCDVCNNPMPDGYTGSDEFGQFVCRKCCKRLGYNPWYEKGK